MGNKGFLGSLPRWNYCCCCIDLKSGTLILGILHLLAVALCVVYLIVFNIEFLQADLKDMDLGIDMELSVDEKKIALGFIDVIILVFITPTLLRGILLVVGACSRSTCSLMSYIVISSISIICQVALMVYSGETAIISSLILDVYFLLCVNSYYQQVLEENAPVSLIINRVSIYARLTPEDPQTPTIDSANAPPSYEAAQKRNKESK